MDVTHETLFANWFRDAAPYIHAHRNRTFVTYFSGEAVADSDFKGTIHDFAILNSLGIRLVLVHGIRPQIEKRLTAAGLESHYHKGIRITDSKSLQCVKESAGTVRVEIEALLSMGLSNSPMAGEKTRVCTGNFVTAKPLGVRDGIDFCHTGEIRRVDSASIQEKLDQNNVVVISPIGYSPTGEIFNLSAETLAVSIAIDLAADKLIILADKDLRMGTDENPIRQLTTMEAKGLLCQENDLCHEVRRYFKQAIEACESEVKRTHLVDRKSDGAIFQELFTRDGVGTLISSTPFEVTRTATLSDVSGILELITPLENKGILVKRSREVLETEISCFTVIDRDGLIVGCAALYACSDDESGELACIALQHEYTGQSRGTDLLEHIETSARSLGLARIFVLTTQTIHWFLERGFVHSEISTLPADKRDLYNYNRNSKVLIKRI